MAGNIVCFVLGAFVLLLGVAAGVAVIMVREGGGSDRSGIYENENAPRHGRRVRR